MLLVGPFVAAGQHFHAAVFGRRIGKGEPQRNYVMRVEPVIGGILVPRDELAVLRVFEPEGRQVEQDIRADQVFDRVENFRMMGDVFEPLEGEVAFDTDILVDRPVDGGFEFFELAPALGGFVGCQAVERGDVSIIPELLDLCLGKTIGHFGSPAVRVARRLPVPASDCNR